MADAINDADQLLEELEMKTNFSEYGDYFSLNDEEEIDSNSDVQLIKRS
jgi:hypothetical protein